MKKDFINKFKKAYQRAKELGFENYFVSKNNGQLLTWEDINMMIDAQIKLPKEAIKDIETNVDLFFKSQENLKLIMRNAGKFAKPEEEENHTQTLNKQTIDTGGKEQSLGNTDKSGSGILIDKEKTIMTGCPDEMEDVGQKEREVEE